MSLEMDGAGVGWTGQERDRLRVLQIAHVEHGDAVRVAVADIGIAAMHHDLDAVAPSALVGMADELDVARRYRIHGLPLPCRANDVEGEALRRDLCHGKSASEHQWCYQKHHETHLIAAQHPDVEEGKRGAEPGVTETGVLTPPACRPCAARRNKWLRTRRGPSAAQNIGRLSSKRRSNNDRRSTCGLRRARRRRAQSRL